MTRRNLTSHILANCERLLENPNEMHEVLDTAIGCIVTSTEHAALLRGDGWARYVGVPVYDTAMVPPQIVQLHIGGCSDTATVRIIYQELLTKRRE